MVFCPRKAQSLMQRRDGYSVRRDGCRARAVIRVTRPCQGLAWEPDGLGRWVSWNSRENRVLQEEKGRLFWVTGDGTVVLISLSHCCGSSLTPTDPKLLLLWQWLIPSSSKGKHGIHHGSLMCCRSCL